MERWQPNDLPISTSHSKAIKVYLKAVLEASSSSAGKVIKTMVCCFFTETAISESVMHFILRCPCQTNTWRTFQRQQNYEEFSSGSEHKPARSAVEVA
ncbi:uncharacterized protein BJ212DRAFT_1364896 [Suillus subaureus]|uniref:Uncharacterized protein n=1 Tax=Suillus subaureus TaxID=48587 RepID=A0A9P7JC68_9AGAM|nr:uncharacterized protein BJ212DRAFT_1364896 [Suillus subaureus]KAG1813982.1 hypothetical protein BJ212DRAFT_1364896 [Suillus subaureus]